MTNASFKLFLFILAFAPLAFGTVEHWSMTTVQVLTGLSLLLCLAGLKREGEPLLQVPGLLPLCLLVGVMVVQLVPLPPGLVKLVSPSSWEAYRPVYEVSGKDFWMPISVNQKATIQELLRISAYVLFYILTIQVLRRGVRINRTLIFIAVLAAAIAFIAVLQQFSSSGQIYWFRPAPGGHPGGPWVNINQYAAFIGAMCPLVLALFLYYRPSSAGDEGWRERFVAFFAAPKSNLHLFLGFAFVLLAFSVFVSLCRGGIVTILASMILFVLLYSYKRRNLGRATLWVALCLALLMVSWFGWQPIIDEFDRAFDTSGAIRDARLQLWSDTLVLIRDFPLVGGGFGTFVDLYPSYKTLTTNLVFEHAHNDYLEVAANGGLLGFILAAWFCATVLLHGWRKVTARRDRLAVLAGIGAIVSTCALLMHSVVDFNLQNGAVGLYFFFVCGLLVAVVNHSYQHYQEESLLPAMTGAGSLVLPAATALFLIVTTVCQLGVLTAGYSYAKVNHLYVSRYLASELLAEVEEALHDSMRFDPFEGRYPFELGRTEIVRRQPLDAFDYSLRAARLQPMAGPYLQRLAMLLPTSRQEEAETLMEEGYRRALDKDGLLGGWVEWLLITGKREQAIGLLKERFEKESRQLGPMLTVMAAYEFSREEIETVLPQSVQSWVRYGEYLDKTGDLEGAGYFRAGALDFLDRESEVRPGWFTQLISYYRRQNEPEKALAVIRLGVGKLPDYAPFRIWLGDHYRQEGITYRAKEEYERAVMLEPGNDSYRKKLKKLELDIEFGN